MRIGTVKEIKNHEYRVGLTPAAARQLVVHGHTVLVEAGAGAAIGLSDAMYEKAGAGVLASAEAVFADADLLVKVKEPQPCEIARLREGQILFTYLHLAPDPAQTESLLASKVSAIAYETVGDAKGGLPLLAPMSEVAGRMAVQAGAHALEIASGGRGVLLGGVPGVPAAAVTILGAGVVGTNAARMAAGAGAQVRILDTNLARLAEIDAAFGGRVATLYADLDAIEAAVTSADLVIGAVLVAGAAAPKLVSEDLVARMIPGSVIVDVAIDQGGCVATSHPTTHDHPTFVAHDVVHYCVANMPGAVARTSTFALVNATQPFVQVLADKGLAALADDPHLCAGLNVHRGLLTNVAVAEAQGRAFVPADRALAL